MGNRRFLPSFEQVKSAIEELPDPASYESSECSVAIKTGSSTSEIDFKRVKFNAGDGNSIFRWVYEGKIMIRSSDMGKKRKKSKDKDDGVVFSVSMR